MTQLPSAATSGSWDKMSYYKGSYLAVGSTTAIQSPIPSVYHLYLDCLPHGAALSSKDYRTARYSMAITAPYAL